MSRAARLNVALAVAVAALGAWAYLKPVGNAPAEHPLSLLKPAEARAVRIERPGAPAIQLVKRQGAWLLTAPFAARGDEGRVQRLLELLDERTAHKLPATDLARFELDAPQARVTVDEQVFSFGVASPVTREQYVLTNGAVFAVPARHATSLPAHPSEMASPRLLGPDEMPVRIALKAFTVEQRDGAWAQTPPEIDPSQDDFLRWVEFWRLASAARVEPFIKGMPLDTIRIELKDGAVLALGVIRREPELVLLRADEKLLYYFRADVAKRLLSPPGTEQPRKP
jgi:hypothetical protein